MINKDELIKWLEEEVEKLRGIDENVPDEIDDDTFFDGEDIYEDGVVAGRIRQCFAVLDKIKNM